MKNATRYLAGLIAFGFLLAGVLVFLQNLTGERTDSYVVPCFLVGGALLSGWFAWNFGSGLDNAETCEAESDDTDAHSQAGSERGDTA